jgi:hypothetical protein
MFICGNDAAAKQTVIEILKEFGWPAIDIGGIEGSRLLEPLCLLWVSYGIRTAPLTTLSSCLEDDHCQAVKTALAMRAMACSRVARSLLDPLMNTARTM